MAEFKHTRGKRVLSGLGVLALAAGLFGTSPAFAQQAGELGNIDTSKSGSLTIHKHKHQDGTSNTQNPDGSGNAIGTDGIADVEFIARQLTDVNLGETNDWDKLENLDLSNACESIPGRQLGAPIVFDKTNSQGITSKDGLAVGAYVVCETNAPATVVDRAQPFLVTIPTPFENSWLYDVNVYPKNGVSSITKSVEEQGELGLGSIVNFPVTVDVPLTRGDELLSNFDIADTLDARLSETTVSSVKIGGADVNAAFYDVVRAGNTLTVVFNAEGLKWLKTQGNKKIVATFSGKVATLGNGVITNDATLFANDPKHSNGIDSNEVSTNWGDVRIFKQADGTKAALKGAEFEIYEAEAPYAGGTCADAVATGNPVSVNGSTTFTSDDAGLVNISGLFVSDSVNETINATQRCYVLKETKAPAGFVTPSGDKAFTGIAVKTGATATTGYDVTVTNFQKDVPDLPLTGANGQLLMVVGGTAVLLVAGGLIIVSRRRAAREDAK